MNTEQITSKLRDFVRFNYKVPETDPDFSDDVHIFDYGYVDSFGAVELTSFVEKEFGIKVTDQDLVVHPLNTINEIAGFVAMRKNESE